ncbi:hypothetical protein HJC23_004196 [Cyclotella cryptica]|uniref:PUL domain-containing protein n=1 Tax=Cyclotella cryptica TaxID=29204 RepID=A0ABD3Q8R6_9STRA
MSGFARESCFSIIKHYSDPIYFVSSDDKRVESAPYFDTLLGQPCLPDLPPFCQVWYQRLLGWNQFESTLSKSNGAFESGAAKALDVARGLLCCYESSIHLCVAAGKETDSDVPAVRDYDADRNEYCPTTTVMTDDYNESGETHTSIIGETIYAIADDISHWATNLPDDDEDMLLKIQNFLFPYLLRLLSHCVALLSKAPTQELPSDAILRKEALSIVTVISVPFVGDGRLNNGAFGIGSLLEWILSLNNVDGESTKAVDPLSLSFTITHCRPYPITFDESLYMSSDFITRPVVDWSVPAAQFKAAWSDGISGIGHRMGVRLLNMIRHCVRATAACEEALGGTRELSLLLREICQIVGIDTLATTTRAFFYGRLAFPISPSNDSSSISIEPKSPLMPVIERVGAVQEKTRNGTPSSIVGHHVKNKMCLSSAAIILSVIFNRRFEIALSDKACLDTIPVVLSLLDDTTPFNQGVGALIFIAVMSNESANISRTLERFHTTLTHSLQTAVQLCGREDAAILAVLCLAQTKWFEILSRQSLSRTTELARTTTCALSSDGVCVLIREALAHLFDAVRKQTNLGRHDGSDIRIGAALVAGINPLLNLLAELPLAASTEIGRAGLATILPLVGWLGMTLESRSIQIAALCSLLSLMKGAHPIMTRHGTKIMVELFALLHRLDKDINFFKETLATLDDEVSTAVARQVCLYAAAVALVAGGRGAEVVLSHVELENCSDAHVHRCRKIRNLLAQLTNALD